MLNRFFAYVDTLRAGDRALLTLLIIAALISSIWAIAAFSTNRSISTPTQGGTYTEGLIGAPRFINPVLAVTQTDRDLSQLVYAGLMRIDENGTLTPDLAESVTRQDDGRTYEIHLREDLHFSDGTPLTTEDVAFTIHRLQDPLLASPQRANWNNVTVDVLNARDMRITLPSTYTPFIENLTVGILPAHRWSELSNSQLPYHSLNTEPIGAGPYMVESVKRDDNNMPYMYRFVPNTEYHAQIPRISEITFRFYDTEEERIDAFNAGDIEAIPDIDSSRITDIDRDTDTLTRITRTLPRTYTLFFNQANGSIIEDSSVREALDILLQNSGIAQSVLGTYGTPSTGPVPAPFAHTTQQEDVSAPEERTETARAVLKDGGWTWNEDITMWEKKDDDTTTQLTFKIATINAPIFTATAEYIRTALLDIGIPVTIQSYTRSNLTESVIHGREFDTLLFGTETGRIYDLFPFWHSSRIASPGLNVSAFENSDADTLLESLRTTESPEERDQLYTELVSLIKDDRPALFLFSPKLVSLYPNDLHVQFPDIMTDSSERFDLVHTWYRETERIWPLFSDTH